MSKKKRLKRSKDDIENELKDQLKLLINACKSYDSGFEAIGKHISVSLRVLLNDSKQSRSLLEQIGLRERSFFDTGGSIKKDNLMPACTLTVLKVSGSEGRYVPRILAPPNPNHPLTRVPFAQWWNEPVLKDKFDKTFSRRDLVKNVADTDGGAHVDSNLDASYLELSRRNSLGWIFNIGNIEKAFEGKPELACMRQIAEEVLMTLTDCAPEYFSS